MKLPSIDYDRFASRSIVIAKMEMLSSTVLLKLIFSLLRHLG